MERQNSSVIGQKIRPAIAPGVSFGRLARPYEAPRTFCPDYYHSAHEAGPGYMARIALVPFSSKFCRYSYSMIKNNISQRMKSRSRPENCVWNRQINWHSRARHMALLCPAVANCVTRIHMISSHTYHRIHVHKPDKSIYWRWFHYCQIVSSLPRPPGYLTNNGFGREECCAGIC